MSSTPFANPASRRHRAAPLRLAGWLMLGCWWTLWPLANACRADEIVRQVQEELRKRNLYYGDIDGRSTGAVASALRRYQDRKGFPASGSFDGETLHSLGITISSVAAQADGGRNENDSASGETKTAAAWPLETVLRSDTARRERERRRLPAEDTEEESVSPSASPSQVPVVAAPTEEQAREFILSYLRACETNQLEEEMKFYADPVDYFDQGPCGPTFIRQDVKHYNARWPERKFELQAPFEFTVSQPHAGLSTVHFFLSFRYHHPVSRNRAETHVSGRTENSYVLQGSRPEDLRIVSMREQRVR